MAEVKSEYTYAEIAEEVLDVFRRYRFTTYDTKEILKTAMEMTDRVSVVLLPMEDAPQPDD